MEDKWKLVPAFLQVRGLVQQHIDSDNYFIDTDLQKIVAAESNCVVVSDFYLKYTDIRVGKPYLEENSMLQQLTPHD
jgi:DNA-directed RNA polymerase III subunit RPC2